MALRDCPERGKKISDKAERCPHCGAEPGRKEPDKRGSRKVKRRRSRRSLIYWIGIPILLVCIRVGVWWKMDDDRKAKEHRLAMIAEEERADSIRAVEAAAEAAMIEKQRQDSIEWVNFTSPDLAIFNLHGHVKSVKGNFDDEDISLFFSGNSKKGYEFSYDGGTEKATKNNSSVELLYDDDGYIIKVKYSDDFGAMDLVWTKERKLSKIEHSSGWFNVTKTTFNYDDEGNIKNVTSESLVHGVTVTTKRNYKILEKDKFGNWIKMNFNQVQTIDYSGYDGRNDVESDKSSGVITRDITYYTDDYGYPLIVKE